MILFDLRCHKDHVFEAWFLDGETYEAQQGAGDVACPICGSLRIAKAPMAPRIGKTLGEPCGTEAGEEQLAQDLVRALERLCKHIEVSADDVGEKFPDEARRIQGGKSKARGIYGEASSEEHEALLDEGIEVIRIPWIRRRHHS